MTTVDTNVLIYFLEKNPAFYPAAEAVVREAAAAGSRLCVSAIALTEILSGTSKQSDIVAFMDSAVFDLRALNRDIAISAGNLRYRHTSLRTADAIHLATALEARANLFITADKQLAAIAADYLPVRMLDR